MFPLPPMQVANQEVTVVTYGEIQAKLFWFSLFTTVRQDQVGMVDGARIKSAIFMAW